MSDGPRTKPRVMLIHNFLTPYRVPLFAELAARFELQVWILGDVRSIREWPARPPEELFSFQILPHIGLPAGSRDYRILLNPTLPFRLRRGRCDVLICCGWDTPAAFYAAYWARWARMPFVLWSGSTAGEPNWRRSLSRPMVRNLVRRADAWIAYGTRAQEYLLSLGAREEGIFRAFNTVDTTEFARASAMNSEQRAAFRRSLGIGTRHMMLYSGQLIERKGLPDLLRALADPSPALREVTLLVAGSGPRRETFEQLAGELGIADRVRFLGFVPRTELPPYYGAADLFALPSREEVWGLVINEALACGAPVLTTEAVGAAPDLLEDGANGYTVPAGAPGAIRAALERHFGGEIDRAAMAERARASMEPFTIARAADAFAQAIAHALGKD